MILFGVALVQRYKIDISQAVPQQQKLLPKSSKAETDQA